MYFLTYEKNGMVAIGVLTSLKDAVIPLVEAERQVLKTSTLPATMLELLDQGQDALNTVHKLFSNENSCPKVPLSDVKIMAPIPRPRKNIFCIGKN